MSEPPEKSSPSTTSSVSSIPSSLGGTSSGRPPARSIASTYASGITAAGTSQTPQRTLGSAYAVIPITGLGDSATLEEPLPLVARDRAVEELLLGARVVEVVVDHLVAEGRPRHAPRFQRRDRLAERMREALRVGLVRVPVERGRKLEPLLDPV